MPTILQVRSLLQQGQLQQAELLCRTLLTSNPGQPDALHVLGQIAQRVGKHEDALRLFAEALLKRADSIAIRMDQINTLFDLGRYQEAASGARKILQREPVNPGARFMLALSLHALNEKDAAVVEYRKILATQPKNLPALQNLGLTLKEIGQLDEALLILARAQQINPTSSMILSNMGIILKLQGKFSESTEQLEKALQLNPNDADAHSNLGTILQSMGETKRSLSHHARALELAPNFAPAHWAMAPALLASGNLPAGWNKYAWRMWAIDGYCRPFPQTLWQGEALLGKTLLIWGDQGLGDEILFAGGIGDAASAGAQLMLECEPRLVSLFRRSFPSADVSARENPPFARLLQADIDYHTPAGDLARWFRPTIDAFPTHHGYLIPDMEKQTSWKHWLKNLGTGIKVGISWRSMMRAAYRDHFYTALSQWGKILSTSGVTFINLQYGECDDELTEAEQLFDIRIIRPPGINLKDDLDEAAALTQALDLVIGPKTSVTAMAGAVGVPTWLLNLESDWTMLGTGRMPWFPSVDVFAKSWDAPWEPLLGQVAERLGEWVSGAFMSRTL